MFARVALVLILIAAVLLSACQAPATPAAPTKAATSEKPAASAPAAGQPKKGGHLQWGHGTFFDNLDPVTAATGIELFAYGIYSPLVEVDEQLNPKPGLAESWEASPDLMTYTFKLRKGVKFHDDTDFNAAAVKFQIDRILDPTSKAATAIPGVNSVDVVDDHTVRFNLSGPLVTLPLLLNIRPGMIASPTAVKKWGADYGFHPVGTGPFKFVEFLKDDHVTLERFEGYWDKQNMPYLDRFTLKSIPDVSVLLTNVRSGTLDLMFRVPEVDANRLKNNTDVKITVDQSIAVRYIQLSGTRPPFNNNALRQAVAYALDTEAINKGLYFGLHPLAHGLISPASWAYDANINPYKRDLAKAKAKLAEGGKPNGFSFELVTASTTTFTPLAEAIKAQLAEVGIEAVVKAMPVSESAARSAGRIPFEAILGQVPGFAELDYLFSGWTHSKGASNVGRFGADGARIDPLIEKARSTVDPKARKELYRQVQQIINDEALELYVTHFPTVGAVNPKVKGLKIFADGNQHDMKGIWLDK